MMDENRWKIVMRVIPDGDCLRWTGNHNEKGYGRVYHKGKVVKVHRLLWELDRGPIPEGMVLDHTCQTKDCVMLDHMQLLSVSDHNKVGHQRGELKTAQMHKRFTRQAHTGVHKSSQDRFTS
jgi:hypothetical protein